MGVTHWKMKIELIDENTSLHMVEKSNAGMSKLVEESYIEASALVNKFTQWREESQRHLVSIIDSYNKNIDESFNELVKEVSDFHGKVPVIKNEVDDLPAGVEDLDEELMSKITPKVNLMEAEENLSNVTPISNTEEKARDNKTIKALQRRFGSSIIISSKTAEGDEEDSLYDGNNGLRYFPRKKQKIGLQNKSPTNEEVSFSHSIFEDDIKNDVADDEVLIKELAASNIQDNLHKYITLEKQRYTEKRNGDSRDMGSKLKCEHCQYETFFKRDLKKHLNDEHDYRKWECDKCPFVTRSSKHVLTVHMLRHDNVRKYKCEQCGYAAKVKGSLWKHKMFVHKMGDKRFRCEKCPYASAQSGNLKTHIKHVHDKIPYGRGQVCDLCGFTFSHSSSLKTHKESVHKQGEKKFKCEQCPFASLRNEHLKRHIEGVHDKKKDHICDECGHATSQKSDLKSHMATVHKMGDKLKCDHCTLEVYSQQNLKQHIRSVHTKNVSAKSKKCQNRRKEERDTKPWQKDQKQEDKEQPQEDEDQPQEDKDQPQDENKEPRENEEPHEGKEIGQVQDESDSEDDAVEIC